MLGGVRMILRYVDFHICEEGIEIFHEEISNQFHLLGFEMQYYEINPKIS